MFRRLTAPCTKQCNGIRGLCLGVGRGSISNPLTEGRRATSVLSNGRCRTEACSMNGWSWLAEQRRHLSASARLNGPPTTTASPPSADASNVAASMVGTLSNRFLIPPREPIGVTMTKDQVHSLIIPASRIRNFAIIAHVDHGKTTLSDAVLRRTGVLPADGAVGTYMDKLEVEKRRGITVKAQTCSMFVKAPPLVPNPDRTEENKSSVPAFVFDKNSKEVVTYMLNLIDTPGHVDFSYEVSRSLGACEGTVLLIDSTQGIEAQTMANLYLAMEHSLTVIPTLSKLDAALSDDIVLQTLDQIEEATGEPPERISLTAAKAKRGVEDLLLRVIAEVPEPKGNPESHLKCLVFDAWTAPVFDDKGNEDPGGVVCLVRIVDGSVKKRDIIHLYHQGKKYQVKEVGVMYPEPVPTKVLRAGQVGYISFALGTTNTVNVGETIVSGNAPLSGDGAITPFPGFRLVKPVVFAGFFPGEKAEDFPRLESAVKKLVLTDPSVSMSPLSCEALGQGLQLGFLGMLHLQVFQERLSQEFHEEVLVTPPTVAYKYKDAKGVEQPLTVYQFKNKHEGVSEYLEPWVNVTLVLPAEYNPAINLEAVTNYRAEELEQRIIDRTRLSVRMKMPFADLLRGFFLFVKTASHGYAHLEYDDPVFQPAELVKVDILVNKRKMDPLSSICVKEDANKVGRRICLAIKENLDKRAFEIPIQASIGNKIIHRETIAAVKKDVTLKIRTDATRKQKKLDIQKDAAKRIQRNIGDIVLDQDTLIAAMGAQTMK